MNSSSALEAGRAAAAERHWANAYELLARVDATGGLAASDLDLLSTVALLRGELPASVDALSRAYDAHLARDDTSAAARSAGWLALSMIDFGDFTRSVAWAARAMRLVSAMAEPGALAGFVRLAPAIAMHLSGNPAEARHEFEDVLAIAERHDDPELSAVTLLSLGKSLIELGAIAEAFGCYDRAMAAVAAGDIAPVPAGIISCAPVCAPPSVTTFSWSGSCGMAQRANRRMARGGNKCSMSASERWVVTTVWTGGCAASGRDRWLSIQSCTSRSRRRRRPRG